MKETEGAERGVYAAGMTRLTLPRKPARFSRAGAALALAPLLALGACGNDTKTVGGASSSPSTVKDCPAADGSAPRKTSFDKAPGMCIDTAKTYTATMTTDAGTVVITLDAKKAPKTVNNFVVLSRYHFYDGLTFHRVIKGFMAQGGDPAGDGSGGPGYTIDDEYPKLGEYKEGSIAMANTGQANSGGSQFFIITGPSGTALPPQYSLFGQVTSGMDVVKKIEADGSEADTAPAKVHRITKVTIAEK